MKKSRIPFELTHITIHGWMISVLQLKDKELIAFALVYGFSQDGESEMKGGSRFRSTWLTCTRPTEKKAFDGLVDKGYILKRIETVNEVDFNRYRVNFDIVWPMIKSFIGGKESLLPPRKESLLPPRKESLHSNNILSKDNLGKDVEVSATQYEPPPLEEVSLYFEEKLLPYIDKIKSPEHWAAWEAEKFITYWGKKQWKYKRKYIHWQRRVVGWIRSAMEKGTYTRLCPTHPDYGKKPWEINKERQDYAEQTLFDKKNRDTGSSAIGTDLANRLKAQ